MPTPIADLYSTLKVKQDFKKDWAETTKKDWNTNFSHYITPVAGLSASATTGTYVTAITFTDTSTNSPTSWLWNFGDSTTSTLQNPVHTYAAPGTYTVSLVATNPAGTNTGTRTSYITLTAVTPVASFTASATTGVHAVTAITFTDSSTNTPASWLWNFGDSTTSTSQNPVHTYADAGTYTVSLTATNSGGSHTSTRTNYIVVS